MSITAKLGYLWLTRHMFSKCITLCFCIQCAHIRAWWSCIL